MSFLSAKLKALDFYPKTAEDYRVKTVSGATISIVSMLVILVLVFSEFMLYLSVERMDELYVDTSDQTKIPIYMNITFPTISCDALTIDMMDVSGEHQIDIEHSVFKTRLDLDGNVLEASAKEERINVPEVEDSKAVELLKPLANDYCGSCYGSEDDSKRCCNTCDEVRESYRKKGWAFTPTETITQCTRETLERKMKAGKKEGCNMYGSFLVNKVAGNFHFAPGRSFQQAQSHVHDYMPFEVENFNTSHTIHRLGFGHYFPGLKNPLDSTSRTNKAGATGLYQYFIKVVPTIYEYSDGEKLTTNQYSVTEHFRPKDESHMHVVPGVFFMYDLNPIMVHIRETRKSFVHFLTSLCAIVGGVFTVAGILDQVLHSAIQKLKPKPI